MPAEYREPALLGPAELRALGSASPGDRAGLDELIDVRRGLPARPPLETFSTGLADLDHVLGGGLRRKEYTVVLAPSGLGKSSFVEQIALEVAERRRVAYFTLELGRKRTTSRLLAKLMRLDIASADNLLAHRPDHKGLAGALDALCYEHRLILEERDHDAFTWDHLASLALADSPDLVIIDDLQCIDGWTDGFPAFTDERDKYHPAVHPLKVRNDIIRGVRLMAELLNCHVLIPHQTRRDVPTERPALDDCADTIQLVRRADTVIALHRPFRGQLRRDDVLETILRKNRNGPECILHHYRNAKQLRFEEMTPDEERELECCKPKKGRRA